MLGEIQEIICLLILSDIDARAPPQFQFRLLPARETELRYFSELQGRVGVVLPIKPPV